MSEVILSAAIRSNVLTLQKIGVQQSTIQNRLATGLKVSSAIDDPRNFFQSQALNNRATDLNRRLDGMGLAIKTFEAADKGIKAISRIVENMSALVKEAKDATGPTTDATRESLRAQYDALRIQLQDIAEDSGFNGINLLAGDTLTVAFNEGGDNNLSRLGVDYTNSATVLGLDPQAQDAWAGAFDFAALEASISTAITSLRTQAANFGTDLTLVRIREDFTKEMMNTLKAGADGLVLADQNEEAANLLALNTRQQLSQQALALASQSEQSILRLLG
jgi:flagellin-like hook-associated protein FlgL